MFLNSNGHGQALQFVMQGYSDSIKAKSSNQGSAMANAFNQGLSNAVQTHDAHEQALQNREATRLQNEYMNKTMEDRVRHQAQQTEANDLANDYTRRTLDDRVAHEGQRTTMNALEIDGKRLNNNYQAKLNEEQRLTSDSRVNATNNQNYAISSQAKLDKEHTDMQRANYEIEKVYTDGKGNYFYDSQRTQAMDSATAQARMQRNAVKEQNRREYQNRFTSDNRQVVAGNQAQEAQNTFNMKIGDQQNQMYDEAKTAITQSGDNFNELYFKLGEASRNNESEITLRNGTKMSLPMAELLATQMLRGGNSGGIGGGININHADKSTIRERDIDAAYNLYHDKDDPQARDRIAMQQKYKKEYGEISKSLESISHFSQIMQDLGDKNRASLAIGSLTRFIGGGEDYAKFKVQNSITLASMAKQTFGGQISDRDMQIMMEQTAKMWESTPATMKRLEETLANQISILQGKIKGTPVGINIMTPEQQQQYIGLTKLYQAIMQGKKK